MLMKSTGGRVGDFLFLGMKGGVWKKTRFGTAMVMEKYWNPPLLCVCWVLVIEWKCVWNMKVHGHRCTFEWAIGSNGSWAGGMGPALGVWSCFVLKGREQTWSSKSLIFDPPPPPAPLAVTRTLLHTLAL